MRLFDTSVTIMTIESDLKKQLTESIRNKELPKANVIRMIKTKVMEKRTSKGFTGDVDDQLYIDIIKAYQKSLKKALDVYEKMGDAGKENVQDLTFEITFLSNFLPEPLSEDKLTQIVRDAMIDVLDVQKEQGRIIGSIMKQWGDRLDAGRVRRAIMALNNEDS